MVIGMKKVGVINIRGEYGMKKEQNNKIRKKWIWNGSIAAALVAAVVVFIVMLQMEENMLAQYEKDSIYVVTKEIPKGQVITKANYEEYMTLAELDKGMVPQTALGSIQQIEGLAALYDIETGTLLTQGMFEELNQVTAQMQEPVIAGFKAEDMYQVVGGTLRAGDRINIYNVDENGMAIPVWSNVYVQQVFDSSGTTIASSDAVTAAQRVNVYMDGADAERFYSELASGTLRVVKVCD